MEGAGDAAGLVVGGEGVVFAVERELSVSDSVAVTPDGRAKVGGVGEPAFEAIVAVSDVSGLAVLIGDFETDENGPVFGDLG